MKISEMYPSRFLKAEDFEEGQTFILTIASVGMEELGQGQKKETKPVAYFLETEKALVLNKTNANVIAQHLGDDTEMWIGKKVAFTTIEVDSFGEIVRAIRVKTKQPAHAPHITLPPRVNIPSKSGIPGVPTATENGESQ